jgi:hypothetical protein
MSEQKPSIGRIVLVETHNEEKPAMITRVWSDDCVNLTVFDDSSVHYKKSVMRSESGDVEPACWRWPPRV